MAAKRFQTRTEEEIDQLLYDKSSKSTNKATDNAMRTLRDFCKGQNLDESFQELGKTQLNFLLQKFCNKVASWHPYILLFWVGRITKHLMTGPSGDNEFCFPSTLNVPLGIRGSDKSALGKESSVPFMRRAPNNLGSRIRFRIFPKKRTLLLLTQTTFICLARSHSKYPTIGSLFQFKKTIIDLWNISFVPITLESVSKRKRWSGSHDLLFFCHAHL